MAGFSVIRVVPLWKKEIYEENRDYSRVRYDTSPVTAEAVGPAGQTGYTGRLGSAPVKPGTVRITDGTTVTRDDPAPVPSGLFVGQEAPLIGPGGITGQVNYFTGVYTLTYPAVTTGAVTADYEQVTEEWPYHAARIDLEISLNPGGDLINPVPLVDEDVVRNILARAEETRPIHVLLRSVALVTDLRDDVAPTATDEQACVMTLKDVRPGSPHLGVDGLDSTYILDFVPDIASDVGVLDEIVAGNLARRRYLFEERAPVLCPMDAMTIEGVPGGPIYV
jgi:hypothetical protein